MGKLQNKVKNPGKLLMRLMNYIFRDYKFHCIAVFILIFVGVIANVQGTMFIRDLLLSIRLRLSFNILNDKPMQLVYKY